MLGTHRSPRVYCACSSGSSPQLSLVDHPFLGQRLGTFQLSILCHNGTPNGSRFSTRLCTACWRSKKIWGITMGHLGIAYRDASRASLLPPLGNYHRWDCRCIAWGTDRRQRNRKGLTSQLGYLCRIHGQHRTKSPLLQCNTILLSQRNVLMLTG